MSTMELQKYYEFNSTYNHYCVHFANKQGLSIDRIKEIFEEFGNVLHVGRAGNDYGYRFVKYREENEVKFCIEGLKNHRHIKLLPKRLKQENNDQYNVQQRLNNWTTNNYELRQPWGQKNTENNGKFKNYQNDENRSNEVSPTTSQLSPEILIPVINEANDSSNKTKIKKPKEIIERNEELRSLTEDPQIGWEKISLPGNIGDNFQPEAATLEKIEEPKIAEKSLVPPPDNSITINEAPEMLAEPSSRSEIAFTSDLANSAISMDAILKEIPELVETDSVPQKKKPEEEVTKVATPSMEKIVDTEVISVAEEVYVANVPTDYDNNYICRLFEKFEPIWVGPIKYVESTAIRFCIVFFRLAEQANACESQFDGHELGGKALITLRPQALRDIAASN